ncbi:hypothetical protein LEN26_003694 [Aphanomyces euteiches]|nr:hypothetical protein LEN26_003694 [Aphanomyces euteiches]
MASKKPRLSQDDIARNEVLALQLRYGVVPHSGSQTARAFSEVDEQKPARRAIQPQAPRVQQVEEVDMDDPLVLQARYGGVPHSGSQTARAFSELDEQTLSRVPVLYCDSFVNVPAFQPLDTLDETIILYNKIESPFGHEHACEWCGAMLWKNERLRRQTPCCGNGKIKINTPTWEDMYDMQVSRGQYTDANPCSREEFMQHVNEYKNMFRDSSFGENSRKLNALFAYTSIGTKELNLGHGPPKYKIQGQLIHNIGSCQPPDGKAPSYAQVYVLDANEQLEWRSNRATNTNLSIAMQEHVKFLQNFMTKHNAFATT